MNKVMFSSGFCPAVRHVRSDSEDDVLLHPHTEETMVRGEDDCSGP